jgi:trimeric autotransporter adhesin
MPSTYTPNNGIEIIATGEQSGTWGDTTNTNLELIDVALDGQLIKTLAVPGISSSPNALAITDGDQSDGRNRLIVFTDGGDLGSTAYVQLTPNDAEKIIYVRNDLAGGRSIIFFQGTYNASNDFELPAGKDAIVKFNGGGSGAITSAVFEDLYLANATVVTLVNTNLQVSNIAALDGTSAGSIADSTGLVTLASSVLTTADINGGTLDNVTIGGDTPAAATFTTATATNVQVTNIKANDGTSAMTVADSTGVVTIPSAVSTNVQVTNIKANDGTSAMTIADSTGIVTFAAGTTGTTQTLTTIDVTNINAHDGTASATIADATGVMTVASSVLTTTDINGGTIDGVTIGGASAGAGTFTSVTGTSLDMNGDADFAGDITLSQTSVTTVTRTDDIGVLSIRGGSTNPTGANVVLYGSSHPTSPSTSIFNADTMLFRPVDLSPEFMRFVDGTGVVFNETSADLDFRIESDALSHAFFVRGSDGYVGIGTGSPAEKLEVTGNIILDAADANIKIKSGTAGTAGAVNFTFNTDSTVYGSLSLPYDTRSSVGLLAQSANAYPVSIASGTTSSATNAVILSTSGEEAMRVTYLGRVGIGTSSPAALLDVNGAAAINDTLLISRAAVAPKITFENSSYAGGNGGIGYFNSGALTFDTNGSESMRITAAGYVGIGADAPSALLDVDGDALVNGLTVGLGAGSVASNTAVGYQALVSNTTGANNSAHGYQALYSNTTGINNSANGYQALYSNTEGLNNSANGVQALYSNTTGGSNVANGSQALYSNTTASANSAAGYQTLYSNTTGASNSAVGYRALYSNTEGNSNTASGREALYSNTTASGNSAAGYQTLYSNTTGGSNSAYGYQALYSNTTANNNIAIGRDALYNNTTGSSNSAAGYRALYSNTEGGNNSANGFQALYSNTTGGNNSANGYRALYSNTTGGNNVANGVQALYSNTEGNNNVANGVQALYSNTTGNSNTGIGVQALYSNTTGTTNTATGRDALFSNTTGSSNSAAGYRALYSNTEGTNNTANGYQALYSNTTGNYNIASGQLALYSNTTGGNNVANGSQTLYSNTTGINNTAVGVQALYNNTTGSGNTAISPRNSAGTYAPVFDPTTQDHRFCMGSTSVTNAYIQVAWTVVSDERDKTELAPVPHGLDFVRALKPTSFRYKAERDSTEGHGPTRYGFLAQEVLALEGDNPVIIDNENPEKLRMTDQSLIAVLVNAIQDQQKIIEGLEQRITALETN